jgi:uncharacterized protein (DUF934 family)
MNNLLRLEEGVARIVADDPWTLLREPELSRPVGMLILPLAHWLESPSTHAVWLGPDDEVESLVPWLTSLPLIALDFPSFRDGRAYSQAYLLRSRFGWAGELRAIGDVSAQPYAPMRF